MAASIAARSSCHHCIMGIRRPLPSLDRAELPSFKGQALPQSADYINSQFRYHLKQPDAELPSLRSRLAVPMAPYRGLRATLINHTGRPSNASVAPVSSGQISEQNAVTIADFICYHS
jgi:hypothetical protein